MELRGPSVLAVTLPRMGPLTARLFPERIAQEPFREQSKRKELDRDNAELSSLVEDREEHRPQE